MNEGQKFDNGKPRFSLIPKGSLAPVINVLEYGARKYSEDNWRKVANADIRYFDAAHRHLNAWWDGQTSDPETGESHLAHAVSCLLFLIALEHEKSVPHVMCSTCAFYPCQCSKEYSPPGTYDQQFAFFDKNAPFKGR